MSSNASPEGEFRVRLPIHGWPRGKDGELDTKSPVTTLSDVLHEGYPDEAALGGLRRVAAQIAGREDVIHVGYHFHVERMVKDRWVEVDGPLVVEPPEVSASL